MFATKDDTFCKSFVERDNISSLERDIKHDNAWVETIFDNLVSGKLDKITAKGMLEYENRRYIEFVDFLSSIDKASTRDFNRRTLPFIYTDYMTLSFENIERTYPTSRIKLIAEKDGDIIKIHYTVDYSILDPNSNDDGIPPFNVQNTFNKDFWQPAEGEDCYIFTEKSYNENVAWVNDICDKQKKDNNFGIPYWSYCYDWKEVIATAWDIMRIRHKMDIVENFQQNVLKKAIEQLISNDKDISVPSIPTGQIESKPPELQPLDPAGKPWESDYNTVVSKCDGFDIYAPILIYNGYINGNTFRWDSHKASIRDFAKFFKAIKKTGQGEKFWWHIVLLFSLAPRNDINKIQTKCETLTKYANDKNYTSDTLDNLLGIVGIKKNP